MCFSAEASFGTAAVLLPAGVYCVRIALVKDRAFLCLAVIPLIFSVQQLLEGLVWTGLGRGDPYSARMAGLFFLVLALPFWPFWIPFCAFLLEPVGRKKWLLGSIAVLGLAGGLGLYLPLALDPDLLRIEAMHHSVYYDIERTPAFAWMSFGKWQILYCAVVASPPIISPSRPFFMFGIAIVVSALVSHLFFWYASASVWCFCAALLSLYLRFSFRQLRAPTLAA